MKIDAGLTYYDEINKKIQRNTILILSTIGIIILHRG